MEIKILTKFHFTCLKMNNLEKLFRPVLESFKALDAVTMEYALSLRKINYINYIELYKIHGL